MLALAMDWLLHELNQVLTDPQGAGPAVVGGNVAHLDAEAADPPLTNKVVLTVVNLEEEKTLRNQLPYEEVVENGQRTVAYRQPPAFLNAYVLFSATHVNYRNALRLVGDVVTFFQRRPVLTAQNSPGFALPDTLADARLVLDLHSLSFEQLNHLWASLGGKQMPFALYRCRLLKFAPVQAPLTRKPILTVGERVLQKTSAEITAERAKSNAPDTPLNQFLEGKP